MFDPTVHKRFNITLPDGEVEAGRFHVIVRMIETQAALRQINWGMRFSGGKSDRLKSMKKQLEKVQANRSKLEVWGGRVGPEGDVLIVARSMYRQYMSEVHRLEELVDALTEE